MQEPITTFSKVRPFVMAVAFLLFFVCAAGIFLTYPIARSGYVDFRHLYTAGYMVRTGHGAEVHDFTVSGKFQNNLVGPASGALPFNHLAYEALIYVPFSLLGYGKAYFVFLIFNVVILAACVRLLWRHFAPLGKIWAYLPVAAIACFVPVSIVLIEGQDSLLLLVGMAAALTAVDDRKDGRAGFFVGLTLFKFQYALPIVFLFFVWRCWRFCGGFVVAALAVAGTSLWITGITGMKQFATYVFSMATKHTAAANTQYGVHPEGMANLRGLITSSTLLPTSSASLVLIVLSAAVIIWAARWRPSLPGALLAALLVSYHQVISDTSLLVLPLGLLGATWVAEGAPRGAKVGWLVMATFLAPIFLLFSGIPFCLLTLLLLAILGAWNGTYMSLGNEGEW